MAVLVLIITSVTKKTCISWQMANRLLEMAASEALLGCLLLC